MTILYKECIETVKNLNAVINVDSSSGVPDATCGSYALINSMISDLSSIKASMKTEEKNIITDVTTTTVSAGGNVNVDTQLVTPTNIVVSDLSATSHGAGASATGRHEDSHVTTAQLPAVLKAGTQEYSESAVFSVLAECNILIHKLKAGTLVGEALTLLGTTLG